MEWFVGLFPDSWQDLVRHAVVFALVFGVSILVYWLARSLLGRGVRRGKIPEPVAVVGRMFARWTVIVVALVMILQDLGLAQGAWALLSAVAAMVAVGFFAVWSTLANIMCTLLLLIFKPFKVGDTVELVGDGVKGRVIDLTFMFTTLREEDGALVRVPNVQFFQRNIRCYPGERVMELDAQLVRDEPAE